jgi:hypothetical protein
MVVAGCGGEVTAGQEHIEARPAPVPYAEDPDALFDEEGNLRESDVVVAGLRLPRGLEEQDVHGERRHAYVTEVPITKVLRYFGPRLMTGHVTQRSGGATYENAVPQGVQGGVVRMDVAIHPRPRIEGTRIEIYEWPPVPQNPPSPEELIRRFDEEQRRLD